MANSSSIDRHPTALRCCNDADLTELMTWFETGANCEIWGGPNFEFPFTTETFRRDTRWASVDSFSFDDDLGRLLGFGQIHEKIGRIHITRIVIRRGERGAGLGSTLLNGLLEKGAERFPGKEYSLYVNKDNDGALSCYRKAGFSVVERPLEDAGFDDCIFMVRSCLS
jgi:ribosomal protein S18 acetylase RimI-like enzyme